MLVHGAGGSVGASAVQMAHHAGVRVVATAGRDDLSYVRGLGADVVCDYRADRFEITRATSTWYSIPSAATRRRAASRC